MSGNPTTTAYPLTPMQQGMLFHSLDTRHTGVYVQQMICVLHHEVNVSALKQAWQRVVDRHPILRTGFRWEGCDEPLQEPQTGVLPKVTEHDWRGLTPAEQQTKLNELLHADRQKGFNMNQAPLMRINLVRTADADSTMIWTFHHILLDGRSHFIVLKEVFDIYEALCQDKVPSLETPAPFADFIAWQRSQDVGQSEAFWRQLLKGFRATTPVGLKIRSPGDPAPTVTSPYGKLEKRLPEALTAQLKDLAKKHNLTLNTLIQGAWALLLSRYSNEPDVVFGATRACRRSALPGADGMVGLFINTVPVRAKVPPDMGLLPWLQELRQQSVDVRDHEHTPLVRIQVWSDVPRGSSLFDSILVFENYALNDAMRAQGGNWLQREFRLQEQVNYPMTVAIYGGDAVLVKLLYHRDHFDDQSVTRLFGHFQTLFEGMVANPECKLGQLPLLTADERHRMIVEWNDTKADFPRDQCIHHLVEAQVAKTPDAVAVVHEGGQLTFREVNEQANQLAHYLRSLEVGPNVLVGICVERSPAMIVGALAILKAGGAYVPLDPNYPKDRLEFMLEDTKAPVLLTQTALQDRLPSGKGRIVCLDAVQAELAQQSRDNPPASATPDNLSYIIYTSGSTGKPKGVVLRHRPVVNLIDWVNQTYKVGPGDRVLFVTSLNFDLSVYDVFGILSAGATVRIAAAPDLRDPQRLLSILLNEPITFWDSAPAMLQQVSPFFATVQTPTGRDRLRLVFLSGDWIPVPLPDAVRATFPKAQVVSLGGATEAAIWSNFYPIGVVDPKWPSIPYGKPIKNARYHVLDPQLQPTPVGVVGELHIGGGCLAEGYLNRPELNAERFIPDPFFDEPDAKIYKTGDLARYFPDGNLEFLGRIDNQVKIRGYRIELGELEALLNRHPSVRDAVVVARPDASGQKALIAYLIPREGQTLNDESVKEYLREKVPDFMVPAHFMTLSAFPLSPNGKVDRKALPDPQVTRAATAFQGPRNDIERGLTAVWEEVLGVKPIGVRDNFFELGGHSLLAARLFAQIATKLGKTLPLRSLFTAPTIEDLAKLCGGDSKQPAAACHSTIVPLRTEGGRPPIFFIAGIGGHVFTFRELSGLLGPEQPSYGLEAIGIDGGCEPHDNIEDIAKHYLREIAALRPQGTFILAGYSLGGRIAYEMAQQLHAQGRPPAAVIMLDAAAPGYPKKLPLTERLGIHFRNFARLPVGDKVGYVRQRAANVLGRVKRLLGMRQTAEQAGFGQTGPVFEKVYRALSVADETYRPKAYPGKIVVLATTSHPDWPATKFDDPALGWRDLVKGGVTDGVITGEHLKIFEGENVKVLAERLRDVLKNT